MAKAIANVVNELVFGQRFEYDAPELTYMLDDLDELTSLLNNSGILVVFPWLRYIPWVWSPYKVVSQVRDKVLGQIIKALNDHK